MTIFQRNFPLYLSYTEILPKTWNLLRKKKNYLINILNPRNVWHYIKNYNPTWHLFTTNPFVLPKIFNPCPPSNPRINGWIMNFIPPLIFVNDLTWNFVYTWTDTLLLQPCRLLYKLLLGFTLFLYFRYVFDSSLSWHRSWAHWGITQLGWFGIKGAQWYSTFFSSSVSTSIWVEELQHYQHYQHYNQKDNKDDGLRLSSSQTQLLQTLSISNKDLIPFRSGSVAQIYLVPLPAWLRQSSTCVSSSVAVLKLRHESLENDARDWKRCFQILFYIERCWKAQSSWMEIWNLFSSQMDFRQEAHHLEEFTNHYASSSSSRLLIPKVYAFSERCLLMEYIPSVTLYEAQQTFPQDVWVDQCRLMKCWVLDQLFVFGTVHGDLHHGNWGLLPNHQGVVLYDFGYVFRDVQIKPDFYRGLYKKDVSFYIQGICRLLDSDSLIPWLQDTYHQQISRRESQSQAESCEWSRLDLCRWLVLTLYQKICQTHHQWVLSPRIGSVLNLISFLRAFESFPSCATFETTVEADYFLLERWNLLQDFRESIIYSTWILPSTCTHSHLK